MGWCPSYERSWLSPQLAKTVTWSIGQMGPGCWSTSPGWWSTSPGWWSTTTVDGRNPARPVEVCSFSHSLWGFCTIPGGCLGFLNHQQYQEQKKPNWWSDIVKICRHSTILRNPIAILSNRSLGLTTKAEPPKLNSTCFMARLETLETPEKVPIRIECSRPNVGRAKKNPSVEVTSHCEQW